MNAINGYLKILEPELEKNNRKMKKANHGKRPANAKRKQYKRRHFHA